MSRVAVLAAACVLGLGHVARAQGNDEGWRVAVYPIIVWVPLGIDISVDVPPINGDGGESGKIIDGRLDGAYYGGVSASNGVWRIEGYALWAGVGGDRPERPLLTVDLDLIYADARVGRRIAPDLFVTGGVRRVAFEYNIAIGTLPQFSRKPGIWDPVVGIGWHREGPTVEWHAAFEGGGFGVGADVDLGGELRVDWKPLRHFGFTAGYNFLYLKVTDEVLRRTVTIKPTLHGPTIGVGLYF